MACPTVGRLPLGFGPLEFSITRNSNHEETRAMLRNAVLPSLQYIHMDFVATSPQFLHQRNQQRAALGLGEVGDVLEKHCPRIQPVNNGKEALPQVSPFVESLAVTRPHKVPNLGSASPRERLTRRSPGQKVNIFDAPFIQLADEVRGIGKVSCPSEALDICGMSFG